MGAEHTDIRDILFEKVKDYTVTAAVSATREGIIYGIGDAEREAQQLGLELISQVKDGMYVRGNETILMLRGTPKQIAMGEDRIIGHIAKASGVATAAHKAKKLAAGRAKIVCGSTKKLMQQMRMPLRHAILEAGVDIRIAELPFVYLDKNYLRIFGGMKETLEAAKSLKDHTVAVQLRGDKMPIVKEAEVACAGGADILMVDTGNREDIRPVIDKLVDIRKRESVQVAFAGNVQITDIPQLCETGVDIICIGRDIADAPMLDLKFDVISSEPNLSDAPLAVNLLEKSELWIENITLDAANLNEVAAAVASVLELNALDVPVVDVRPNHITLDILRKTVEARQIAGKEKAILEAVGNVKGVHLGEEAFVHSNGILGLIALDEADVPEILENTYEVAQSVRQAFQKRACIFPTGFEVQQGLIRDTNSPYIAQALRERGYTVDIMPPLPDQVDALYKGIDEAANSGYSLIITTGGVGAEDKDFTVEAVSKLDPQAATPWLVRYQKGTGRHVKEGIRIAVGTVGDVFVVSFPGPNDEVRMAAQVLCDNLETGLRKFKLAQELAEVLRDKIRTKAIHWKHHTM